MNNTDHSTLHKTMERPTTPRSRSIPKTSSETKGPIKSLVPAKAVRPLRPVKIIQEDREDHEDHADTYDNQKDHEDILEYCNETKDETNHIKLLIREETLEELESALNSLILHREQLDKRIFDIEGLLDEIFNKTLEFEHMILTNDHYKDNIKDQINMFNKEIDYLQEKIVRLQKLKSQTDSLISSYEKEIDSLENDIAIMTKVTVKGNQQCLACHVVTKCNSITGVCYSCDS
jgi:chromosome segregation ATPase